MSNPLPYSNAIDALDDARDLLRVALAACNQQVRFQIRAHDCDSYQLASRIGHWLQQMDPCLGGETGPSAQRALIEIGAAIPHNLLALLATERDAELATALKRIVDAWNLYAAHVLDASRVMSDPGQSSLFPK